MKKCVKNVDLMMAVEKVHFKVEEIDRRLVGDNNGDEGLIKKVHRIEAFMIGSKAARKMLRRVSAVIIGLVSVAGGIVAVLRWF